MGTTPTLPTPPSAYSVGRERAASSKAAWPLLGPCQGFPAHALPVCKARASRKAGRQAGGRLGDQRSLLPEPCFLDLSSAINRALVFLRRLLAVCLHGIKGSIPAKNRLTSQIAAQADELVGCSRRGKIAKKKNIPFSAHSSVSIVCSVWLLCSPKRLHYWVCNSYSVSFLWPLNFEPHPHQA